MVAKAKKTSESCFDEFDKTSPKRKEPSIQILYEYEKHYLELIRQYSSEISLIEKMLIDFRNEQEAFYKDTLPKITKQLNQDIGIDPDMKKVWLERLTTNIDRSFNLSETLINDYATKKIDEFKRAVTEKLRNL